MDPYAVFIIREKRSANQESAATLPAHFATPGVQIEGQKRLDAVKMV